MGISNFESVYKMVCTFDKTLAKLTHYARIIYNRLTKNPAGAGFFTLFSEFRRDPGLRRNKFNSSKAFRRPESQDIIYFFFPSFMEMNSLM